MAKQISRRNILKAAGLTGGLGALTACGDIALPGISARADNQVANTIPPPPTIMPDELPSASSVRQLSSANTDFTYEIQYTDREWRTRLTPAEYKILREGGTEPRHSHRYTRTTDTGIYHCEGCHLPLYNSDQKVIKDIGWVFFRHSLPNSMLMGVDGVAIEAHCRRCVALELD